MAGDAANVNPVDGGASVAEQLRAFQAEIDGMRARIQGDFAEAMNQKASEMAEGLRAEMEANSARAHELAQQLKSQSEQLRGEQEAAQQATSRVAQARLQLEAIEAARASRPTVDVQKELAIANDRATADWRKRLETEMGIAQSQWNELLQGSLDSNLKKMVEQLSERSADLLRTTEQRMTEKLDDWREPFAPSGDGSARQLDGDSGQDRAGSGAGARVVGGCGAGGGAHEGIFFADRSGDARHVERIASPAGHDFEFADFRDEPARGRNCERADAAADSGAGFDEPAVHGPQLGGDGIEAGAAHGALARLDPRFKFARGAGGRKFAAAPRTAAAGIRK